MPPVIPPATMPFRKVFDPTGADPPAAAAATMVFEELNNVTSKQ